MEKTLIQKPNQGSDTTKNQNSPKTAKVSKTKKAAATKTEDNLPSPKRGVKPIFILITDGEQTEGQFDDDEAEKLK